MTTGLCQRSARVENVGTGFLATCACGRLDRYWSRKADAERDRDEHKNPKDTKERA